MMFYLWLVIAYISGAAPWSVWLGKLFYHIDPRRQPDGNPGAANAFRSAGWKLGIPVLLLDFFKAFIPVFLAFRSGNFTGWQLFWIAFMPTVGHCFSIFLGFRGGRAITALFGVWTGLTLYLAPLVMGATAVLSLFIIKNDELRAMTIPIILILFLAIIHEPLWMIALGIAQMIVLAGKIALYLYQKQRVEKAA